MVNKLTVFQHQNTEVVDSRDVAKAVEKNHKELLRDIRGYVEVMEENSQRKIAPSDFFIESSFASRGKQYPCYLLTKKGCDMVANKMTGEKGVLFTAAYVTAFEQMREHIQGGKAKIVGMTEYQQMMARSRAENVRIRKAQILERLSNQYDGTYKQVLQAHVTKELTGEFLLPLPKLEAKTYSAEDVGGLLGITACKVGILANRHNLKSDQYGEWFKDKAKGCNKEIPTFRYYENVIPVLREILESAVS